MAVSEEQFEAIMMKIQQAQLGPEADAPEVNASLKLPSFWQADPDLWFFQIECVFQNRSPKIVLDATKFNHAVAALPHDVLGEIRHIIAMPHDATNRYAELKKSLSETYGKDLAVKQAELLEFAAGTNGLGDRKPINLSLIHI